MPPFASKLWPYGTPTVAAATAVVLTVSGGALTLMLRFAPAVCILESVSVMVKFEIPVIGPVAVPEMTPDGLSANPAGRLPPLAAQLYGLAPPVAASV